MSNEDLKKKLVSEGFKHIYEWQDKPGTKYPPHAHKGKVAMYILEGGLMLTIDGKTIELKKGDRFDVPVGVEHSAGVGPNGCSYLVGEMIEGDS